MPITCKFPARDAFRAIPGWKLRIHDKTPEEKYEERQKQSRPVLDAMFEWLHTMEDSVDRSSLIGDAILYTLNQEVYLRRYLEDGHLSIDNNSAERALKNFAVGRRNWLFAKSVRGADASALVYSITETALLNHLKPYAYLTYILDELRKMGAFPKEEELKKLLPWSEDLPKYCRTKLKKNTKPSDIGTGKPSQEQYQMAFIRCQYTNDYLLTLFLIRKIYFP